MKIEIDDLLYCHNSGSFKYLTVGKDYKVVSCNSPFSSSDRVTIICDDSKKAYFTIDEDVDGISYQNFFTQKKQLREKKLKTLLD